MNTREIDLDILQLFMPKKSEIQKYEEEVIRIRDYGKGRERLLYEQQNLKDGPLEVNVRLYLVYALGVCEKIDSAIDTIYNKDRHGYHDLYKDSLFSDEQIFAFFPTKQAERMKKIAGIVEWCYENDQFETIDRFIHQGYKSVWNYLKLWQSQLNDFKFREEKRFADISHFSENIWKKLEKGTKIVNRKDVFYHECVFLYLAHKRGFLIDLSSEPGEDLRKKLIQDMSVRHMTEHFRVESISDHQEEIDALYDELGLSKKIKTISLDALIQKLVGHENYNVKQSFIRARELAGRQSGEFIEEEIDEIVFNVGIGRYCFEYGTWLGALGINERLVGDGNLFTKEDLDHVFAHYCFLKHTKHVAEKDMKRIIVMCLFTKCIVKEYQATRELYFTQIQEDLFHDMELQRKSMEEKEQRLKQNEIEMGNEHKRLKAENARMKEQLEKIGRENAKLRNELDKLTESENNEQALHDLAHEEQYESTDSDNESYVDVDSVIEKLASRKIAIVGGHPNWQRKMKEILPDFFYVDAEELGKDLTPLKRVDCVFVNTAFLNHPQYRRATKQIKSLQVPIEFLNHGGNTDISVTEIYSKMKDFEHTVEI